MPIYFDKDSNKNNGQTQSGEYEQARQNSGYQYSWNRDDFVRTEHYKKPRRGVLKGFAICLAFFLMAGIITLAGYGAYNIYTVAQNAQTTAPQTPGTNLQNMPNISIAETPSGGRKPLGPDSYLTGAEIVKMVKPSVVGIVSTITRGSYTVGQGTGSGVVMSEDGFIITNQHVVDNAAKISVVFEDGREFAATLIGEDRKTDLAVVKIEAAGLAYAQFGDSEKLEEGEPVIAIGNPMGLELFGTTTAGVVSAINRNITIEDRLMTLIQTDAAINRGNSGGPLINQYGQVIGINSAKIASSEVEGLSFAIPTSIAIPTAQNLIAYGYVKDRPMLGISGGDVSQSTANYYDVPQGVVVSSVTPGGGAEKAGILQGDIIVKFNDKIVRNMSELNSEKDKFKAGDTVYVSVYREGENLRLSVTLTEASSE